MARHGGPAGPRRLALRRWVPYVLLAITAILSVYAAAYVSSTEETRRRSEFFAAAAETRTQIEIRLDTYVEIVRAGAALLAASNEIHHAELRAFVRRLELGDRYPGLEAIGFSQRVRHRDLPAFARSIEIDEGMRLKIHPSGERPEYQPVVFVEPMDDAGTAIGFDLSTDPSQREAMDRARDTGMPALSARTDRDGALHPLGAGTVVLYTPVYRTGAPTATVEDRRRALHGFVFSPIRADILLSHVTVTAGRSVAFEVYDGPSETAPLIHASAPPHEAAYASSGPLSVAGRDWLVVLRSAYGEPGLLPAAQNALWAGLLLSVLLFAITRIQVRAWETAKRHEAELLASEGALRSRESQLRELVAREQAARTQAQQADRAKDDFLVGLSHELRTPLNAMLGWLHMLQSGAVGEQRRAHALEVIERNARLQARLIEDLLDVSRILLGKIAIERRPLALDSVVVSVVDSLRPSAVTKGVELQLVEPSTPRVMLGDAARMTQVVWNLVSNAIKFTPAGGRVIIELGGTDGEVELCVRDTGIGIAKEFLPHVFERFRQADTSTTRAHSGLGVGLSITRHLVQLHGGRVEAHSNGLGHGATFVVRVPAAAVAGANTGHERTGELPQIAAGVVEAATSAPGGEAGVTA